ncbi:TIGR03885 family FMN-dependent LLM class oxidoreductase [Naasia sp. SYSU D00948]|uniref:TIGR03885 family FMN-dependent LLM class oxidoreductase n=1 Tax=Naasia sp. SYSU D00948 TaxID=2817379 RepID=UPI001B30E8B5|nr:TIGR03885 family FMN-dependent LLM class oxidoreductase [Naasia sp. SYSU D00948]
MTVIGFHASHEQLHPRDLLRYARRAEEVGFTGGMCSDHIAPWSVRQGQSGFAMSWLGAALQATDLPFGVVNAPGQRYHPAIIAQAAATLQAMFPGRFWIALGSGENVNESITGGKWPRKELRNQRLRECVDIIRALIAGEEVTHEGLVTVERARLWTLPETPPPLVAPAVSEETAAWAAEWADGLVTINQPIEALQGVLDAYRDAGGKGTVSVQMHLSYADTDDEALRIAHDQWRFGVISPPLIWDLDSPAAFDQASEHVPPEAVHKSVVVGSEPGFFLERIQAVLDLGIDELYLHHVGKDQDPFLDFFGERVLPQLPVTARALR